MPTIFDFVNAKEIASYITTAPQNKIPYMGEMLFPAKKQLGLDLKWIKGSQGLPVALKPSVFDAKATMRDRVGFTKVETEMPFFRESMRIGEKDRQELNKFVNAQDSGFVMPIINNIYDDVGKMVEGGRVQAERMRMQLLSGGTIDVSANRVPYVYDYSFQSAHKETLLTTARWSDTANSDPAYDINRWQDTVEANTGVRPTRAICTRKTFNYLIANAKIKADMFLTTGAVASMTLITDGMVKQYFSTKLGVSIEIYSKKYMSDAGVATNYFADEVFTLIPEGQLGSTFFGTTPEESDLMAGSEAQVQIVNTGIAITTAMEVHPVNVFTIVSGIFLPSFENIDSCFIATVHS
jgi:hypothetical protein